MKRLLVLAALALIVSVAFVPAATSAGVGDAQGPPCSNITNGGGTYSTTGVVFDVNLGAPACSFVTYTFYVTDTSGTLISSTSSYDTSSCTPDNPGEGCVHFAVTFDGSLIDEICVYATTDIHGHLADRAPNGSNGHCPPSSPSLSMTKTSSGAGGSFN
jgi:hypothetical protein